MIGIKSNVAHTALLKEMPLHTTKPSPSTKPTIKFVPAGLAKTIGNKTYAAMLCNNNKFLTSVTTIPAYGFTSKTLDLKINVFDPATQMTVQHSICHILLDMSWCHAIKMTQMVGKFLFVITKAHLQEGWQWLDDNLKPLFKNYITKHPQFVPDADHQIAK